MINISDINSSKLKHKDEVISSLNEAIKYLSGYSWCVNIEDGWIASSFGYILNIFYFQIQPDNLSCKDNYIWVIVGDIPPAYIDIVSAHNAFDALYCYIIIMTEWVENIMNGRSVEECFPVNVPPQKKYAKMLKIRLKMLKEDYLPIISTGCKKCQEKSSNTSLNFNIFT